MEMIPRLIDIRQLLPGDEIIISGNSKLKYMKVLSVPRESDIDEWKTQTQTDGTLKYSPTGKKRLKSFRCSIRQDTVEYLTKFTKQKQFYKKYVFEPDVSKHNKKISIDLNGRDVLLVKREER